MSFLNPLNWFSSSQIKKEETPEPPLVPAHEVENDEVVDEGIKQQEAIIREQPPIYEHTGEESHNESEGAGEGEDQPTTQPRDEKGRFSSKKTKVIKKSTELSKSDQEERGKAGAEITPKSPVRESKLVIEIPSPRRSQRKVEMDIYDFQPSDDEPPQPKRSRRSSTTATKRKSRARNSDTAPLDSAKNGLARRQAPDTSGNVEPSAESSVSSKKTNERGKRSNSRTTPARAGVAESDAEPTDRLGDIQASVRTTSQVITPRLANLPAKLEKAKKRVSARKSTEDAPHRAADDEDDDIAALLNQNLHATTNKPVLKEKNSKAISQLIGGVSLLPAANTTEPQPSVKRKSLEKSLPQSNEHNQDTSSSSRRTSHKAMADQGTTPEDPSYKSPQPERPSKKALSKRKATEEPESEGPKKKARRQMISETGNGDMRTFAVSGGTANGYQSGSTRSHSDNAHELLRESRDLSMEDTPDSSPPPADKSVINPPQPQWNLINRSSQPENEESNHNPESGKQSKADRHQEAKTVSSSERKRIPPVATPKSSIIRTKGSKGKSGAEKAKTPKTPASNAGSKAVSSSRSRKAHDPELEALSEAIEEYRELNGMTQFEVNALVQNSAQGAAKELWNHVFADVEGGRRQALMKKCRRIFHNFEARGSWTEEQDEQLKEAYERFPAKWVKIGEALNRMSEDCRDRWRNYLVCGNNQRKDVWDSVEENKLREVVARCIKSIQELRRLDKSQKYSNKTDGELVDWDIVSRNMGRTRSRLQCIKKWRALRDREASDSDDPEGPVSAVAWRIEKGAQAVSTISATEKLYLLYAIRDANPGSDGKIPWAHVANYMAKKNMDTHEKRLAWKLCYRHLKELIPGHEDMKLKDIVEQLIDAYEDSAPKEPAIFKKFEPSSSFVSAKKRSKRKRREPRKSSGDAPFSTPSEKSRMKKSRKANSEEVEEDTENEDGEDVIEQLRSAPKEKEERHLRAKGTQSRNFLSEEFVRDSDEEPNEPVQQASHNAEEDHDQPSQDSNKEADEPARQAPQDAEEGLIRPPLDSDADNHEANENGHTKEGEQSYRDSENGDQEQQGQAALAEDDNNNSQGDESQEPNYDNVDGDDTRDKDGLFIQEKETWGAKDKQKSTDGGLVTAQQNHNVAPTESEYMDVDQVAAADDDLSHAQENFELEHAEIQLEDDAEIDQLQANAPLKEEDDDLPAARGDDLNHNPDSPTAEYPEAQKGNGEVDEMDYQSHAPVNKEGDDEAAASSHAHEKLDVEHIGSQHGNYANAEIDDQNEAIAKEDGDLAVANGDEINSCHEEDHEEEDHEPEQPFINEEDHEKVNPIVSSTADGDNSNEEENNSFVPGNPEEEEEDVFLDDGMDEQVEAVHDSAPLPKDVFFDEEMEDAPETPVENPQSDVDMDADQVPSFGNGKRTESSASFHDEEEREQNHDTASVDHDNHPTHQASTTDNLHNGTMHRSDSESSFAGLSSRSSSKDIAGEDEDRTFTAPKYCLPSLPAEPPTRSPSRSPVRYGGSWASSQPPAIFKRTPWDTGNEVNSASGSDDDMDDIPPVPRGLATMDKQVEARVPSTPMGQESKSKSKKADRKVRRRGRRKRGVRRGRRRVV